MTKVLVIIESLGFGGAERLLVSLLPELKKKSIEFKVVALWEPVTLAEELNRLGIPVTCLRIKHRWGFLEALWKLKREIRSFSPDILWSHLFFGNLYALWFRGFFGEAKVLISLHSPGYWITPPKTAWHYLRMKMEQLSGRAWANRIVAVSQSVADDYEKSLGWKKIQVIHNGIALESLPSTIEREAKLEVRQHFNIKANDFLIITPARYAPEKGHKILIESLHRLALENEFPLKCIAAGSGPCKEELEKLVGALGLGDRVFFSGNIPQKELFALIQASDAVVLPSIREPFGIAAAEGMALGIPTILTKVDGFIELAGSSGAAFMVNPNDPVDLADAILRVKSDTELRKSLSDKGKKRIIENFDIRKVSENWERSLQNLVSRKVI